MLKNPCDAPLLTQIEHQNTDFGGFWPDLGSSIGPTATFSKKSGAFSEVRSCRTSSATRSPRRRLQKRLPAGETRALYRRKPSSRGSVLKTAQRAEKLLRAIFCAPFRGLKPRLCSVLGSVSKCLASVFTTDHSEKDFFNSLGLSAKFVSIEFSEVRQELSKDNSFEGCVDLRERDIISVGKANSLGEAGKETIL